MAFSFGGFGGFGGTPSGADLGISQAEVDAGVSAQAAIDAVDAGAIPPDLDPFSVEVSTSAASVGQLSIPTQVSPSLPAKGAVETFLDKRAGSTVKTLIALVTGIPVNAIKNPFVNADGTPKGVIGDVPGEAQGLGQAPGFDPPAVKPKATPVTPVPGVTDGDADRPSRRGAGRISRFGQFSRRTILTGSRGLSDKASTTKKTLLGL